MPDGVVTAGTGVGVGGGGSLSGVGFFLVPRLMEDSDRGNLDRKAGVDGGGGVGVTATTWVGRWWTGDLMIGLNMCMEGI